MDTQSDSVQAKFRTVIVVMIIVSTVLFAVGPMVLGLLLIVLAPGGSPATYFGMGFVAVGVVISLLLFRNNASIELVGNIVRERRMFTGIVVERPLGDIVKIVPLVSGVGGLSNWALDAMLGTTNRGFLIQFKTGRKLALVRGDIVGTDDFMLALRERMGTRWLQVTQ